MGGTAGPDAEERGEVHPPPKSLSNSSSKHRLLVLLASGDDAEGREGGAGCKVEENGGGVASP